MAKLISFLLGFTFCGITVYFYNNFQNNKDNSYVVLTNQIEKMNKMIVAEQTSSSFVNHKNVKAKIAGFEFLTKELMVFSEVKAQITYDLKKLKYTIDKENKKLIIEKIPNAEIKFYPNSKIHYMDESIVNQFDKNEINNLINTANQKVISKINQNTLRNEARKQLIINLNDLFVLAKALNYTIEDKSGEKLEIFKN